MTKALTIDEAKAFYDRFGKKQDAQGWYEDAAVNDLIAASTFDSARRVFEFGCGTGRVALRLLDTCLAGDATYEGVDVSTTMIDIAGGRLREFGGRARVRRVDGNDPFAGMMARPDRIVTTYVLDLLPEEEIARFISRCAEVLEAEGRLCIASLTFGNTLPSRFVSACWRGVFRLSPKTVGGCRPIRLLPFLEANAWTIAHHRVVSRFGVASEVVVAQRL